MSYPRVPGYNGYYGSANQGQEVQNTFNPGREKNSSIGTTSQTAETQRPTYQSSGYELFDQSQPKYSEDSRQQTYFGNGLSGYYDGRQQAGSHAPPQSAGSVGQEYYNSTSQSAREHTQAVNHSRRASNLDDSGYRQNQPTQQTNATSTNLSQPRGGVNNQIESPGIRKPAQASTSPSTSYTDPTDASSTQNRQFNVLAATAALAGAHGNHFPQPSAPNGRPSISPFLDGATPAQDPASQRSAMPHSELNVPHAPRSPSSQAHQTRHGSPPNPSQVKGQQPLQTGRPAQHAHTPAHGGRQTPNQLHRQQSQQVNSVSNLVNHSIQEAPHISYPPPVEPQSSMPTHIDPTQIFNPYHAERERRRRDAELETKRKAEDAAAKKKNEEEAAVTAVAKRKAANAASKEISELPKTKAATQDKAVDLASLILSDQPAQDQKANEADMATELKAMMEKMKDFRSQDPTLFQRLWEEMRKPAVLVTSPSPQMSQQPTLPASQVRPGPVVPPARSSPPTNSQKQKLPPPRKSDTRTFNNGYRVVVENNPEGLPDLGRFPAERRIRNSYSRRTDGETSAGVPENTPKSAKAVAGPQGDTSRSPQGQSSVPPLQSQPAPPAVRPPPSLKVPPQRRLAGTVWPEETRNALAQAAIQSLKAIPENDQLQITTADIHAILETNPSYIDLCEMLEQRGFKFDRGHFARRLLNKAPSLETPPPKTAPAVTVIPLVAPLNGVAGIPAIQGPPPNAIPLQFHAVSHPVQTFKTEQPATGQQLHKIPRSGKHHTPMQSRAQPPLGTKEAMSRKRDFAELVDLTALSDNEDYVLSKRQARAGSPSPEVDPFQGYHRQTMLAGETTHPGQLLGPTPFSTALPDGSPLKFDPNPTPLRSAQLPVPGPQPPLPAKRSARILAKAIDPKAALRRSYYNPKTVAHDILIAAGRHPTERPLNAHMAGMLGTHIELESDLSTFDWDAIDPGGPPLPQAGFVDVPTEPPRYQLGQKRSAVPPGLGKKDVRLPDVDKRPLPATANMAMAPRVESQLTSGQARPILNGNSRPSALQPDPTVGAESSARPTQSVTPKKRKAGPAPSIDVALRRSTPSSSTQATPPKQVKFMETPGSFYPSGKRRGRPPGAKNLHPSVAALKIAAKQPAQISVSIPSPTSLPVFRCRWKNCHIQLHNMETLRNHVSRVHEPTKDEIDQFGYICWWKRCRFLKVDENGLVHSEKAFDTVGEWLEHVEEDHLSPIAFKNGDGPATKHIGKPKSSSFDVSRFRYSPMPREKTRTCSYLDPQTILQDRVRYLADEDERVTTPTYSPRFQDDLAPDTMALNKADLDDHEKQARRSFMKTHRTDKSSPKAMAEETLRSMTARKAKIGPGIDQGGCILVTEARRKTLLQNQGLARVVDADY